ncbi:MULTISPECIES: P-type conjugative transfer protein TrbJ [unclassified Acidovorax]|uniref:P-type conjugative transfer protein TrbJ n=1 Tax=unclassified Acidovorax TaxID=2684926 RepID=UPI001C467F99|nr:MULTISPECIES: P-type conjugative transfer protein TrbJ [unclassified Acidovorax]MBV7427343.1 P-type conjugative transfer protein TrbJ [Acidovorax sp. sif0732]MBV7448467.1 P-type conjugative transfer protein TrbJ [Acidovorax sp. sif0715]
MILKMVFQPRRVALAAIAALSLGTAVPAQAQMFGGRIVFDPSNFSQNILTAARTLEQINNQIRQLQNDALNLAKLDSSALGELRAALTATNQLIRQAQGLAFNVQQMEGEFRRLYPQAYTASISGNQMALDARQRWQNSLEALRTATQVQSQAVQNFASDERTLTDLVNRSQSAVGALQAMQATNQLLALQSRQAMQTQQLQITQDRAVALEQARQVAVQERAREVRRRFQGEGTPYTVAPVSFYGQ